MKKNLFDLDLQYFAEGEEAGENEVSEPAEQTEDATDVDEEGENVEPAEPHEQSAEENAKYAAIRRKAEEDARRRYDNEIGRIDQQIAAMCRGISHPVTGQPITNVRDYVDALTIQQRQAREQELQEKGIDPSMIDRMIESNPVVMQAQRVIEHSKMAEAEYALQNDLAEIMKYDPSIKGINDLSSLPNFPEILDRVQRGASLIDAYKMVNFDAFMQHTNEAARQQAINQMRGKNHLTQSTGVAQTDEYVEVPKEIMSRWKAEGKTEKQIRDLYKKVAGQLHLN